MSGSKCGEVSFTPGLLASGVGAMGNIIEDAVVAYRAAREKRIAERNQAMAGQLAALKSIQQKLREKWKSESAVSSASPAKTTDASLAGLVTPVAKKLNLRAKDILSEASAADAAASSPSPIPPAKTQAEQRRKVLENVEMLVADIRIPLPVNAALKLKELQQELDIDKVAALARDIRTEVANEIAQIAKERQEAQATLTKLPPDFPQGVREALSGVAQGQGRFDAELREIISKTQGDMRVRRQEAAAKILSDTLSQLGYEVSGVSHTIFTEGGNVHIRKDDWEDGYCVKLGVEGNLVRFNMMKDTDSGEAVDAVAERHWKEEFAELKKALAGKGVEIGNVEELSPPGHSPVPVVSGVPLLAKKKKKKPAAVLKRKQRG